MSSLPTSLDHKNFFHAEYLGTSSVSSFPTFGGALTEEDQGDLKPATCISAAQSTRPWLGTIKGVISQRNLKDWIYHFLTT